MVEAIKRGILKMLRTHGDTVSFVDLERLEGFQGNERLEIQGKNIVLWDACSEAAIAALNQLQQERAIAIKSTSPLVYAADGKVVRLPIAKSIRSYKVARWLPAVITTGPSIK